MFNDPQSLTPTGGSALSLARIEEGHGMAHYRYQGALEAIDFKIRHSDVKATATEAARLRHNVEVTHTVYATSTSPKLVRKDYFVTERQEGDLGKSHLEGFLNWILASGVITKLFGKEV